MTPTELYLAYQKDVRVLARRLTRSHAEAEELVSSTFEVLPSALKRYRGDASPRAFLLSICTNLAQHLRRSAVRRAKALEGYRAELTFIDEEDPERALLRQEMVREALAAFEELPEEQRAAFVLAGLEGKPAAQVAAEVGVPIGTVRSRLFLARQKLQAALSRRGLAVGVLCCVLAVGAVGGAAYASPAYRAKLVEWIKATIEKVASPRSKQSSASPRKVLPAPSAPEAEPPPAAVATEAEPHLAAPVSLAPVRPRRHRVERDLELYTKAHALHFSQRNDDEAERAWGEYLRAMPRGRFRLEAEYNRAITLFRLGRLDEAAEGLLPFAADERAGYRQEDARALLKQLDARARGSE